MYDDTQNLNAALSEVFRRRNESRRFLITLDGPCATGKTTLAGRLAESLGAAVLHTDDFVIPHAQKTPERLAVPGGNCDAERLRDEVLEPWKEGRPVFFRRYLFREDRMAAPELLPDRPVLIIEGSYINLPSLRPYADLRLFLSRPWEVRKARLEKRESPQSLQGFYDRWIPLEDAYFAAYGLPDSGCILLE